MTPERKDLLDAGLAVMGLCADDLGHVGAVCYQVGRRHGIEGKPTHSLVVTEAGVVLNAEGQALFRLSWKVIVGHRGRVCSRGTHEARLGGDVCLEEAAVEALLRAFVTAAAPLALEAVE